MPKNTYAVTTQQAIADEWGVSRTRIDQIERAALKKLRSRLLADPDIRDLLRLPEPRVPNPESRA